jgi:hypothetical protein
MLTEKVGFIKANNRLGIDPDDEQTISIASE